MKQISVKLSQESFDFLNKLQNYWQSKSRHVSIETMLEQYRDRATFCPKCGEIAAFDISTESTVSCWNCRTQFER